MKLFAVYFLMVMSVWVSCHGQNDHFFRNSVKRPTLGSRDAYQRIEAEDFDYNFGTNVCNTTDDENGLCLCGIDIRETVAYYLVDFGNDRQPIGMSIRVSSAYSADETGTIVVYAKTMHATPLAKFFVPFTGNWDTYQTLNASISKELIWAQDMIFTFSSLNSNTTMDMTYNVCNVNWFVFY